MLADWLFLIVLFVIITAHRCSNPVTDVRTTPFDMIQTKLIATKTTNSSDDAIIEIVNRHFPCINQPHATITFGLGCDMAKFTMKNQK